MEEQIAFVLPVTPYPSKLCGKDSLPPVPTNDASVPDVNSVSLTIDGIDVCPLIFLTS
jgi:hypothetical protein